MALHGDIRVSGQRIGYWSCRRLQEEVVAVDDFYDYECYVEVYDRHGEQHRHTFNVSHRYSNGALVLAAKVQLGAHSLIRGGMQTHG